MYLPLSPYNHQRYASLNTSVIEPASTHVRTQSSSKLFIPALQTLQKSKVPSQKKLTLTCQTTLPSARFNLQEAESQLKKRGGDYKEMKAKFASLQVSQVRASEPSAYRQNAEEDELAEFKQLLAERFKQLQTAYKNSMKYYENQLKMLHVKLNDNARELQAKNRKIQLLEAACSKYRIKLEKMCDQFSANALGSKLQDMQGKIRVLVHHNQEAKQEQDSCLDNLRNRLVGQLARRLSIARSQNQKFITSALCSMQRLEHVIQGLKERREKLSEGTQGSMENVSLDSKIATSFHEKQDGVSFWDDCFFYPESYKSEGFEHIVEMAKRRQQALNCWLDPQDFLRYSDSDSYIFNRKGDRIRLSREELRQLLALRLIVLR